MRHIIEELRKKPHHHKRLVALGASCVFTGFIFIIWLTTQAFFNNTQTVIAQANNQEASPVSVFGSNVANGYQALQNTISNAATIPSTNQSSQ